MADQDRRAVTSMRAEWACARRIPPREAERAGLPLSALPFPKCDDRVSLDGVYCHAACRHFQQDAGSGGGGGGGGRWRIKYICTDVVEANVMRLVAHPALQTYISTGELDFAVFDPRINCNHCYAGVALLPRHGVLRVL